ncbi:hypothetical protein SPHINGOT1_120178 [Sphingomonas sp. T1]|nr:hypothetical protein SPHINGOT1_120178 [Sphingomonas sp. T1]
MVAFERMTEFGSAMRHAHAYCTKPATS